jgi:hypothetical protein
MEGFFDFMVTPPGTALINALASVYFLALACFSIWRGTISLGSVPPKIRKSESPRAFWSVIGLYAVIVTWTGAAAILNFLKSST